MNPLKGALMQARVLYGAFLVSWLLLTGVAYQFSGPAREVPKAIITALAIAAVLNVAIALFVRSRYISSGEDALGGNPEDAEALAKWRAGQITSFALAESVMLFGIALKFLGAEWKIAGPFFVVGLVLLLVWFPRLDVAEP